MPDKRQHRGAHPDDRRLFSEPKVPALRLAVSELSWLLTRHYAMESALKLVGDRHELTVRQRLAVRRCACSDQALAHRIQTLSAPAELAGNDAGVDGYNVLITMESALSGGALFIGRDGCIRDLASVHGTYRKVSETRPALDLILESLMALRPRHIDWYLDRPVSNSGRLKAFLLEEMAQKAAASAIVPLDVHLVDSPDSALRAFQGIVATSDSAILDRCRQWTNLSALIIESAVPTAWNIDLRQDSGTK